MKALETKPRMKDVSLATKAVRHEDPGMRRAATALLLAGVFITAGQVSQASTLTRGTIGDPDTLDPQIAMGGAAAPILHDLNIGLMTVDGHGRLVPGTAESWTVSEDGLSYTFRLRDGLKWSDGRPMTSADYVYSARRLVTPETAARFASFFYPVKNARAIVRGQLPPEQIGVHAPDERTVVYRLEYPAPYFLQTLSSNAAVPVPRHSIEALGREWTRGGRMVSNGAYRLVEAVPQSHIALEKNPHFHEADEVSIDRVIFVPTQNLETSLRRYLAGELDILLNFPMEQVERLEKERPDEMRISPALGISYLILNHSKAPFDDPRIREALNISVDREGIVDRFMTPGTLPAFGLTPPAVSDYEEAKAPHEEIPMPQRRARARELMKEAGYGPGNPLEITLRYDSLEENRRIAVALAAMWKPLGVSLSLHNTDMLSLNRDARTGNFQILRHAWFAPNDDPFTFLALVESTDPNNLSGYGNPAYDRMLREANTLGDTPERMAKLREAEAMMLEDHPVIPVFFYVRRLLVKPHVGNFNPNKRGINPSRYLSISEP